MSQSNQSREKRILQAAARLIAHFGYDKTTVSDIAREAGISKGAVYLHFESKVALFEALIEREFETYTEHWLQLVEADTDSEHGVFTLIYKNALVALNDSPLLIALFRQDRRVLGQVARNQSFIRSGQKQMVNTDLLAQLQSIGAIRDDIAPEMLSHLLMMFSFGLLNMDDVLPDGQIPDFDETMTALATLLDNALTPPDGGNQAAARALLLTIIQGVQQQLYGSDSPEE